MLPAPADESAQPFPEAPPADEGLPSIPATPSVPLTPDDTAPRDSFPFPSTVQPPAADDAPPAMPADDPFKDEPPMPPTSTEEPGPRSETPAGPTPAKISRDFLPSREKVAVADRAAPDKVELSNDDLPEIVEASSNQEPALLAPLQDSMSPLRGRLQDEPPGRENPLRKKLKTTSTRAGTDQVVAVASWTAETTKTRPELQAQRPNPLRGKK